MIEPKQSFFKIAVSFLSTIALSNFFICISSKNTLSKNDFNSWYEVTYSQNYLKLLKRAQTFFFKNLFYVIYVFENAQITAYRRSLSKTVLKSVPLPFQESTWGSWKILMCPWHTTLVYHCLGDTKIQDCVSPSWAEVGATSWWWSKGRSRWIE